MLVSTCIIRDFQRLAGLLKRDNQGAAFIEFSISLFVLVLLFIGGTELTRYIMIIQKVQDAASVETNAVTSINTYTSVFDQPTIDAIVNALPFLIKPFATGTEIISITDIYNDTNNSKGPTIKWRYCNSAANGVSGSKFGTVGGQANFSVLLASNPSYTLAQGKEVVVAEIYYSFNPMTQNSVTKTLAPPTTIYREMISVPRVSPLYGTNVTFASNCQ